MESISLGKESQMLIQDPKIELISVEDPRAEAWLYSRPGETHVDLDSLESMDFSINELKILTFKVYSSVYFREVLTSARPFQMWSQTSAREPLESLRLDRFAHDIYGEKALEDFSRKRELALNPTPDIPKGKLRLLFPPSYLFGYVYQVSFRHLISLLKWMQARKDPYLDAYVRLFLRALNIDDLERFRYRAYSFPQIPEGEDLDLQAGALWIRSVKIPFYFRAQIARHAGIYLLDELPHLSPEEILFSDMLHELRGQISGTVEYFRNFIFRTRTCWMTSYEEWASLYPKDFTYEDFVLSLPCKGHKEECKYSLDVQMRIEGKDPGLPCPVWIPDPELIDQRIAAFRPSKFTDYYRQLVEERLEKEKAS